MKVFVCNRFDLFIIIKHSSVHLNFKMTKKNLARSYVANKHWVRPH